MHKATSAILAILAGAAGADDGAGRAVAVATARDGSTLTLHDGRGPCVGDARMAIWESASRAQKVPGCWVLSQGGLVLVSFLDGDRGQVPEAVLVKLSGA